MASICSVCGKPVSDGARFCENCGAPVPVTVKCPACGAEVKPGTKFCQDCGAPIQAEKPALQPVQQAAQAPAPAPIPQPMPAQQPVGQPVQQAPIPQQAPVRQTPIQQPVQQPIQQPIQQPQQWQGGRAVPTQPQVWQGKQKKKSPVLTVVSIVLAVLLVLQLAVAGFVRPGWFRGNRAAALNYRMDDRVMELTLPALTKAQEQVYQAGSSATQAYYTARLSLERLLKAAENGVTGSALEGLVDRAAEAFRVADKLSAYAKSMASALEKTEDTANARAGAILAGFDLSVHASAAESIDPELLKWAQEITEMYDKAPAGRQVRTLAEQLGMDAKHAFEVIKQSQAIMKGKYEGDADIANYWYETCMKTKTACKAIVVTTAIISSGGAAGTVGLVDGALLTASGVDAIVEVGDTTVNIVAGEGSQVQAEYSKMKDKIAPITGVAGAVGLFAGGWSTAVDKAGQFIYISDSVHDLVENGKIAGIQLPGTGPAPGETQEQTVKLVKLPVTDGETSPEEVRETLEKLGVPPEQAEKIAEAVTEDAPPADEEEPAIGDVMDLDELTDEELDQLLEELLAMEELEQEFDELFESFDEDIPVEDLPQEGDDEGFDNPENWAKPENPSVIKSEPEASSEGETNENPSGTAMSVDKILGTYAGTIQYGYVDGHGQRDPREQAYEFLLKDGELYFKIGGTYGPMDYDAATGTATFIRENTWPDGSSRPMQYEFYFTNENGSVSLSGTMKDLSSHYDEDLGYDDAQTAWFYGEMDSIYDLICGNYAITVTDVTEWSNGEYETDTDSGTLEVGRNGTSMFIDVGSGTQMPMQFDPNTLTGTFDAGLTTYTVTFTIDGNLVSMHATAMYTTPPLEGVTATQTLTIDGTKTN